MVGSMRKIDFDDLTEAVPAFACIALMVFTYNIANGLTAGLVLYPAREDRGGPRARTELGQHRARAPVPHVLPVRPAALTRWSQAHALIAGPGRSLLLLTLLLAAACASPAERRRAGSPRLPTSS